MKPVKINIEKVPKNRDVQNFFTIFDFLDFLHLDAKHPRKNTKYSFWKICLSRKNILMKTPPPLLKTFKELIFLYFDFFAKDVLKTIVSGH